MKQTAVEFLNEQLLCVVRERNERLIDAESFWKVKRNLLIEAKQMEKEQIIKAYNEVSNHTGEQYYNQTFKNK
jgi:hypothetical protein